MSKPGPILIAEDSENDIELIVEAFEEHRLANRLVVTRNGEEALDYLYRRGTYASNGSPAPVAALLDIKMPKISGIEVLRVIKADPSLRDLPVVMMTSSREEPDMKECYNLGTNAYVVKPLAFEEFVEAVKLVGLFWAVINAGPEISLVAGPDSGQRGTGSGL